MTIEASGGAAPSLRSFGVSPSRAASLGVATLLFFVSRAALAWVFPEHTKITSRALELVDQAELAKVWKRAHDPAARTCESATVDVGSGPCFGFAALPSLAADHSCSPDDLAKIAARSDWAAELAREGRKIGRALERAGNNGETRENIRREMHISFHTTDPEYYERAASEGGHFQLEREVFEYDTAPPSLDLYL